MYGILRALSDELINRQRQKRSFRLIYCLSIQHIRCVEQRAAYRCLHSVLRARTAFAPRPGKTLHRTVLFPRLRVPFDLTKHRGTQRVPLCLVPVVGLSAQIVLCLHSVLRARTAFAPRPGKTLHRTVLFPPASSPVRLNQTQRHPTGASVFGAGGGTRTHTVLLPTDFESVTSANSITPANMFKFCTYISLTHFLNGFKRENHIILKI